MAAHGLTIVRALIRTWDERGPTAARAAAMAAAGYAPGVDLGVFIYDDWATLDAGVFPREELVDMERRHAFFEVYGLRSLEDVRAHQAETRATHGTAWRDIWWSGAAAPFVRMAA